MAQPYELSARLYDEIYGVERYARQAAAVRAYLAQKHSSARTMLEIGCGTGGHLAYFRDSFSVTGIDLSAAMLAVAREKLPDVPLYQADMRTLELSTRFDVVTCLFSSIAYVRSCAELNATVARLAAHLNPAGLLIIEPWFTPEQWYPGRVRGGLQVDRDDLKIARFCVSGTRGRFAVMPMHHLVAEASGVSHFVEEHELFLATTAEYEAAFAMAKLTSVHFDADLLPRGAWIGRAD